jgi:diguanylate cyclase (GGDEF)-like protein/PAS domain S-box-containing protein
MEFSKDAYARIIDNLHDGLYFVDRDRKITFWNKAAERITGFSSDEVVGRRCSDNILTHVDGEGDTLCLGACPLAAAICDGMPREATVYLHHKDGHRVPVAVRISALTDDSGAVIGGIELFTDISNQGANELRIRELEKLALLDTLTQLANRSFLEREVRNRLDERDRFGVPFGVLFIDIDHFKEFNDRYGHAVGDEVLRSVARTMVINSRPFDLYGRWGGEEFLGIIRNVAIHDLGQIGNRLRMLVESSYLASAGGRLQVTISIGAALSREDDSLEALLQRADELLYESKKSGRNRLTLD